MRNVLPRAVAEDVWVAVLAVAFGIAIAAQAADPLMGTWKLDAAKSSYKPGPAMKTARTA